jgi:hypothetical protein
MLASGDDSGSSWGRGNPSIRRLSALPRRHFSTMRSGRLGRAFRVKEYLGVAIDEKNFPKIVEHCGFDFMKKRASKVRLLDVVFEGGGRAPTAAGRMFCPQKISRSATTKRPSRAFLGRRAQPNVVDGQVSEAMQQYGTNFAKTGNPNGGQLLPAWPRFDTASRAYIQFTDAGPIAKEALRRPYCDLFIETVKRLSAH